MRDEKVIAVSRYALLLKDYNNASVWGYDDQEMSYWAQLWRNSSDSGSDPDFWLNWFSEKFPITSAARLASMITVRTGAGLADVLRAMGAASTAPESAELIELAETLAKSAIYTRRYPKARSIGQ
jgi:hypothetical protein